MIIPDIRTRRLILRQWRASDRAPFAALNADPQVMEFFPAPLSREQSDAGVDRVEAHMQQHGWGFWALESAHDAKFIGFVGLNRPTLNLPFAPCVEIGWRLARTAWGKGYATEAARAALQAGFDTLELDEIVSFTTLENVRSRAVMERIGMRCHDEYFDHPGLPASSGLQRHCLYRLSRSQWLFNEASGMVE